MFAARIRAAQCLVNRASVAVEGAAAAKRVHIAGINQQVSSFPAGVFQQHRELATIPKRTRVKARQGAAAAATPTPTPETAEPAKAESAEAEKVAAEPAHEKPAGGFLSDFREQMRIEMEKMNEEESKIAAKVRVGCGWTISGGTVRGRGWRGGGGCLRQRTTPMSGGGRC
jgi:hypothetical protein